MDNDKLNITLSIAGRSLKLTINRNQEYAYREAARKLNNRIDFFYNQYPKADYPMILTVVALEKAIDCELNAENAGNALLTEKIDEWSDLIERVIAEK